MRILFRQWIAEMSKLMARKRTLMGFAAFIALELAILLLFKFMGGEKRLAWFIERQGQQFAHYDSALTLAMIIIGLSIILLGSIYLALVGGDMVAKENEDGHYRLLLIRPISRLRLLGVKYLSLAAYSILLVQFICWSSLALGLILKGWGGGFFVFMRDPPLLEFHDWSEGLWRFSMGTVTSSLTLLTLSTLAFFFSCLPIKPAAASIAALTYFLIDRILMESSFMEDYDDFLLSKHLVCWAYVLRDPIPWALIGRGLVTLMAVNASLFVLGHAVFANRDLKS